MATKTARFIIVLSSLFLVTVTIAGTAQNPRTAQATIPFEFWVGGNCLPAGNYIIEHLESTSYLLLRSTDGKNLVAVYAIPLDEEPATGAGSSLVFKIKNGKHYLYGGWGPFGRRVVAAESASPAPAGANRAEVPITLTEASRP